MENTGVIEKYGIVWPDTLSLLDIELWCYKHDPRPEKTEGRLTRFEHAVNIVNYLWNRPASTFNVVWNAFTDEILYECIYNRYLGIAGCGSSTKSFGAALYAFIEWLAWPSETLALFTSTTKDAAALRCWKCVTQLWGAVETLNMPGNMVPSKRIIRGVDANGRLQDHLGLRVVAAGKGKEKKALDDIQGTKATHLILVADELPKLTKAINTTAFTNLDCNECFEMKALGNPELKLDAFGDFCKPKAGWSSVSEEDHTWQTSRGKVIRFDARKSPRILDPDGDRKYPFFPSRETIQAAVEDFGENSRQFWTMFVGMWPQEGLVDTCFSETELEPAMRPVGVNEWDQGPLSMVLALDPAYSSEGDRSPLGWARCGSIRGVRVLEFIDWRNARENVKDPEEISAQILNDFKDTANQLGIPAKQCGFDCTGWGTVFKHFTNHVWSTSVRAVHFEGKPVERYIAIDTTAETEFDRRVSQLWGQMKPLVRRGQIRGLTADIVEDLVNRMWDKKKTGRQLCIETKREMRKRTGRSPDLGDMLAILVEVAIINGLLDIRETKEVRTKVMGDFRRVVRSGNAGIKRKCTLSCQGTKKLKYR